MTEPKLTMGLTTGPFDYLLRQRVVIDVRLDEPAWGDLRLGDVIEFREDPGEKRVLRVAVIALLHYPTFRALFSDFPPDLFDISSVETGVAAMYQWWTPQDEAHWGVLGIKVEVIEGPA
jgi:ASC-1-like (ASCH) protein